MKESFESQEIQLQQPPAADFGELLSAPPGIREPAVILALSEAGSPSEALRRARALTDGMGGALHLVRVLPAAPKMVPTVLSRRNLKDILWSVERTLTAHRATRTWMREVLPEGSGVKRFAILHGEFIERIAAYSMEVDARLILVPAFHENAGSVVTRLAAATGTAVLLARAPAKRRTILAATDLRDPRYPVLKLAAELGSQMESSVSAVHDAPRGGAPQKAPAGVDEASPEPPSNPELEHLKQASRQLPAKARPLLCNEGDSVDAVPATARAEEADLVVVGTRPRARFERSGSASFASTVTSGARGSVLLTPVGEKADPPLDLAWS